MNWIRCLPLLCATVVVLSGLTPNRVNASDSTPPGDRPGPVPGDRVANDTWNSRPTPPLPGYELVWADEFDGTTLDTNKWIHWLAGRRRHAINTPDAVSLSHGVLTITTYTSNQVHYTGMIATTGKFEPSFGYLEARIDFDDSPGMWSAFWMQSPTMGRPIGDPARAGTEIDIVEHRLRDKDGKDIASQGVANLHWDGYGRAHQSRGSPLFGSNLDQGYHRYALEWTPDLQRFLVDDVEVWRVTGPVSRAPEFIILSSEVQNQDWAGDVPAGGYGSRVSSKTRMKVDYVRMHQLKKDASTSTSEAAR